MMRDYGDAVYQYCSRILRDELLAQDVHQQCFVQAYEDLSRFSRRSSLKTWLYGIAHHRSLDAAKGRRRFLARFFPTDSLPEREDAAVPVDERLAQSATELDLSECLAQLAPAARTAIALRFTEGFTYEEMATICGEKAGTLQARVARALPVLRACMEKRGGTS